MLIALERTAQKPLSPIVSPAPCFLGVWLPDADMIAVDDVGKHVTGRENRWRTAQARQDPWTQKEERDAGIGIDSQRGDGGVMMRSSM
mmetsp:Transcript_30314/g.69879  ORF Transcript_30314/g.69879 Transcript_30314/m.69879 type:complete len:88 (-) Transcript_30314:98-361(-)